VITHILFAAAALVASAVQPAPVDLSSRLQDYMAARQAAARTVPPLTVTADRAATIAAGDALAAAIVRARPGAREGDIFSAPVAGAIRAAIAAGCGERFDALWDEIAADLDTPLPAPAVHGRWPAGAALPTMPPDVLEALPPLPPQLEYRFMGTALVLRDIDANLIVDFVRDAIPPRSRIAAASR
jgi:hypothetical protein